MKKQTPETPDVEPTEQEKYFAAKNRRRDSLRKFLKQARWTVFQALVLCCMISAFAFVIHKIIDTGGAIYSDHQKVPQLERAVSDLDKCIGSDQKIITNLFDVVLRLQQDVLSYQHSQFFLPCVVSNAVMAEVVPLRHRVEQLEKKIEPPKPEFIWPTNFIPTNCLIYVDSYTTNEMVSITNGLNCQSFTNACRLGGFTKPKTMKRGCKPLSSGIEPSENFGRGFLPDFIPGFTPH
jgi:hypothetical protein